MSMRKLTILLSFMLFVAFQAAAQMQVSGTVTNAESGEPIPGVSIVVKGQTTIGTTTDMDGNYTLSGIPSDAEALVYSFVGMETKEVAINGRSTIDVALEPAVTEMEEVIVSGVASATPKSKMTVSVDQVSSDELQQAPASDAVSSLQGKMAGVTVTKASGQPGSGATVQLRGATTMVGSQEPLIMVDGAIFQGNLGDIGVDNIASIEVVKGASASALYGSKAGNGVIVIHTKRGQNQDVGETTVEIRNEFGISTIENYIDLATHHPHVLKDPNNPGDTYTDYAGVTYPDDYEYGSSPGIAGTRILDPDHYVDNPFAFTNDLQKQFFKEGNHYTNYIGVGRREANANFHLSFENNNQGGVVTETQGYERQSLRANVDINLTDNFKVSASNMFAKAFSQDPGGVNLYNGGAFFDVLFMLPDVDLMWENEENGDPYDLDASHWNDQETNPIYQVANIDERTDKNIILGTYRAEYNPWDFLKLEAKYAYDRRTFNNREVQPYDFLVKGSTKGILNKSQGTLSRSNSFNMNQTLQYTAHFNKMFGDWTTKGKVSYLYEDYHNESFSVSGNQFAVSGTPNLEVLEGEKQTYSQKEIERAENIFGIAQIDYKGKYLADLMYRYDGSSLFGEEERWQPYFRVSGGWRISEDFDIPGIQELKIRGAYGTSGQRPGYAAQYETYSVSSGGAYSKSTLGNNQLKPSETAETEVAMNVSFLNRFSFEAVYAMSETDDVFLTKDLAAYKGWPQQWVNAAAMESNSFEATLRANVVKSENFSWRANVTFDRVRSKITRLDIPPKLTGPASQGSDAFYLRADETFGIIYGNHFLTSLDQLPEDMNAEDYTINADGYVIEKGTEGTIYEQPLLERDEEGNAKKVKIGDTNPDFRLGFANTITFKGLTFYALLDWKQGGDVYNRTRQWLYRDLRHGDVDMAGKPGNEKKTFDYYQSLYNVNNISSSFVEDASYVKIRELSLYYDFGKELLNNIAGGFVKGIKAGLIARNVYTFTGYSGYDPEVAMQDYVGSGVPGASYYAWDAYTYPNHTTLSGSLTIKF